MIRLLFIMMAVTFSGVVRAQVTFVVEQLPKSTPPEDTIFIAGDFNHWVLNDPRFMLHKRLDGKFSITLNVPEKVIQYKFHRGSWAKVETNSRNEYVPNRKVANIANSTVSVVIDNWQDAGGARPFDILIFYFFSVGFTLLIFGWLVFHRASDKVHNYNFVVVVFAIFLSIVLFGRVFYEVSSLRWQYYETLTGEVLLFVSGPLWFAVIGFEKFSRKSIVFHAIPAMVIVLGVALKIYNAPAIQFLSTNVVNDLITWNTILFFGSAVLSNATYFFFGWRKFLALKEKEEWSTVNQKFIKQHTMLGFAFILLMFTKLILLLSDYEHFLFWFDRDVVFIELSAFIFSIGFYALKHQEVAKPTSSPVKPAELESFKNALEEVMRTKKSYRNPHLTLTELSEIVNIKPHVLSRVINECYNQNFRDYLNRYRVEEFIAIAQQDVNKRYTFLALANEVGFNSKSTFNAAFKKVTQQSPRDFFKANREFIVE